MAGSPLSAADIVLVMKAAAEHGVLSFTSGDVSFTRTGYVAPVSPTQAALHDMLSKPAWSEQTPPPAAFEDSL